MSKRIRNSRNFSFEFNRCHQFQLYCTFFMILPVPTNCFFAVVTSQFFGKYDHGRCVWFSPCEGHLKVIGLKCHFDLKVKVIDFFWNPCVCTLCMSLCFVIKRKSTYFLHVMYLLFIICIDHNNCT